jgi:hypothetical protein
MKTKNLLPSTYQQKSFVISKSTGSLTTNDKNHLDKLMLYKRLLNNCKKHR